MNRTDRLYAIVEELRAAAPSAVACERLADEFDVTTRTIERDLGALIESGLPITGRRGRNGGYRIDPRHTLPPLALTATEAAALSLALSSNGGPAMPTEVRSALRKIRAVVPDAVMVEADVHIDRFRVISPSRGVTVLASDIERALLDQYSLVISYRSNSGTESTRTIDPVGIVVRHDDSYLVAWCHLRQDRRLFRIDQITSAEISGAVEDPRELGDWLPAVISDSDIFPPRRNEADQNAPAEDDKISNSER